MMHNTQVTDSCTISVTFLGTVRFVLQLLLYSGAPTLTATPPARVITIGQNLCVARVASAPVPEGGKSGE